MVFRSTCVIGKKLIEFSNFHETINTQNEKSEEKLFWVEKTYGKIFSGSSFFPTAADESKFSFPFGGNEEKEVEKVYSYAVIFSFSTKLFVYKLLNHEREKGKAVESLRVFIHNDTFVMLSN